MSKSKPPASGLRIPIVKFGRYIELEMRINLKIDETELGWQQERNKIITHYRKLILDAVKKDCKKEME